MPNSVSPFQIFSILLSLLSIIGIALTIILSNSSLTVQRRAALRESLEQLDAYRTRNRNNKIKPILMSFSLYRFRFWKTNKCTVKLLSTQSSDVSGESEYIDRTLSIPVSVFDGYDWETGEGGYLIHFKTIDPITVSSEIDQLFQRIGSIRSRDPKPTWRTKEDIEKYHPSEGKDFGDIHEVILDYLADHSEAEPDEIYNSIDREMDRVPKKICYQSIFDLQNWDMIEKTDDGKYRRTS